MSVKKKSAIFIPVILTGILISTGSLSKADSVERVGLNTSDTVMLHLKHNKTTLSKQELDCLTKNVYFEASNQSIDGQVAIAFVTLNRLNDSRFPRTICGIISQVLPIHQMKYGVKKSCQFSWYCTHRFSNPDRESKEWRIATKAAISAHYMHQKGYDITNGATHFHAVHTRPYWACIFKKVAQIDDHVFYKWSKI